MRDRDRERDRVREKERERERGAMKLFWNRTTSIRFPETKEKVIFGIRLIHKLTTSVL